MVLAFCICPFSSHREVSETAHSGQRRAVHARQRRIFYVEKIFQSEPLTARTFRKMALKGKGARRLIRSRMECITAGCSCWVYPQILL
jgi:hypothetical protein